MPNKRGEGQNKRGWEISENFNKRMCVCLCVCVCVGGGGQNKRGWKLHDTTGRACCVVQFLAGNFAPKMHARKRKAIAEHLILLLWPVVRYQTQLKN